MDDATSILAFRNNLYLIQGLKASRLLLQKELVKLKTSSKRISDSASLFALKNIQNEDEILRYIDAIEELIDFLNVTKTARDTER